MSDNKAALFQKILAVQKALEPLEKSGKNTFQNYKYTTAGDVLLPAQAACNEHGLVIIADVIESKIEPGKASCIVQLTVIDTETGESHSITAPGYAEDFSWKEGRPTGDKAIYKATTGATKYAVRSFFLLPSEDDPEKVPKSVPQNLNLLKASDAELKRLGWGNEKGKLFLQEKFGKYSRSQLTEIELQQFIAHLKALPTPVVQNAQS
ncbi:ERF family protein [Chroococcidiopsis sp.]|uniref:ERF family protein n=1 Tax=Chroococcidiopsis sp. TaxID=3088168 RepID=UPI003F39FEA2